MYGLDTNSAIELEGTLPPLHDSQNNNYLDGNNTSDFQYYIGDNNDDNNDNQIPKKPSRPKNKPSGKLSYMSPAKELRSQEMGRGILLSGSS